MQSEAGVQTLIFKIKIKKNVRRKGEVRELDIELVTRLGRNDDVGRVRSLWWLYDNNVTLTDVKVTSSGECPIAAGTSPVSSALLVNVLSLPAPVPYPHHFW